MCDSSITGRTDQFISDLLFLRSDRKLLWLGSSSLKISIFVVFSFSLFVKKETNERRWDSGPFEDRPLGLVFIIFAI